METAKPGKGTSGVRKEIERLNEEFEDAFERGDFDGVAALYTEDALFLPPGKPIAQGREEIRETFASYARAGVKRVEFDTLRVEDHGETVLELARSTVFGDSGALRQSYYVIVWKRQPDRTLQLHWDVVASSIG